MTASRTQSAPPAGYPDLVVGIDGGGTTTFAVLADRATGATVGRGSAGPSNLQAVGEASALTALGTAVRAAFDAAGIPVAPVAAACLGLAGVDRGEGVDVIRAWAAEVGLSSRVVVANDATLLFAAGTPDGWGLAVVAGTGSIAFARTPDGREGRCGGWGYLLGDEGSAYRIAVDGLRAACRAFDRCGPPTVLVDRYLARMEATDPPGLIPAVYRGSWNMAAIAGLAPLVLVAAAEGDEVAAAIGRSHADSLARTAAESARANGLPLDAVPVAVTGGVILGSEWFRAAFLAALRESGVHPDPVTAVPDPTVGAVVIARRTADGVEHPITPLA